MEPRRQWCDNPACSDFGKIGTANIRVHSYVEQRYICTTCQQTFNADRGTFFETLHTERSTIVDILSMLVERNSLRAVERLRHHPHNAILHWIDLAGQHAAAVSAALVCNLHITQAQVDELWTFVKKKQEHLQPDDPIDAGDMWIWRAIALPSRLRVVKPHQS